MENQVVIVLNDQLKLDSVRFEGKSMLVSRGVLRNAVPFILDHARIQLNELRRLQGTHKLQAEITQVGAQLQAVQQESDEWEAKHIESMQQLARDKQAEREKVLYQASLDQTDPLKVTRIMEEFDKKSTNQLNGRQLHAGKTRKKFTEAKQVLQKELNKLVKQVEDDVWSEITAKGA